MFTNLHELAKKATLMITIAPEGADQLRVNITAAPFDTKAKASLPQPLSLVATPAEFDADFIAALATWQAPKRTLLQQAQDAAGALGLPAGAGEQPKALPAPEKGKAGRKARGAKPAADTAPGDDDDAGADGDQAGAPAAGGNTDGGEAPPTMSASDEQPGAGTDQAAQPTAPATSAPVPAAAGDAVVDTHTLDLF